MVVPGDPQQGRVDEVGGHPEHQRLPSQGRLRWKHDHSHPRHCQVKLWMLDYHLELFSPDTNISIPRYQHILSLLASHDKPFLLVGPSGTGKTVYIKVGQSRL